MRRAKPPGEQENPGRQNPQEAGAREGGKPERANRPVSEQGFSARNEERKPGTTRPGDQRKRGRGTTRDARKKGDRGKSALEGSEAKRGLKTLRMTRRKTTKDFYCIKVHNGCSETQLSTPIDGRMAKQQPTSGEPEKLKAQVHFQEPNDEQYGAND